MCRSRVGHRAFVVVDHDLSLAVTTYIWPGTTNHPTASPDAVVDRFGSDAASDLVPLIKSLQDELWQCDWLYRESITEAGARVSPSFAATSRTSAPSC